MSEMEEILHASRSSIQFWTQSGALVPTADTLHKGRGVHRSFAADEVIVALVVRAAAQSKLPIERLIAIASVFRNEWLGIEKIRAGINKGIAGIANVFIVVSEHNNLSLLVDPPPDEAIAHTFSSMIGHNTIDHSAQCLIYLTPWLRRAKSKLS